MSTTVCGAPVVVKANGQTVPTSIHCVRSKGHTDPHWVDISWPNAEAVGIVIDFTIELKR